MKLNTIVLVVATLLCIWSADGWKLGTRLTLINSTCKDELKTFLGNCINVFMPTMMDKLTIHVPTHTRYSQKPTKLSKGMCYAFQHAKDLEWSSPCRRERASKHRDT